MNTPTKLILLGTIIGTLGVAGSARLVYASQTHVQVAVRHQAQRSDVVEASDGDGETQEAAQANPQVATVSLSDARKIALEARPGTITDEELEKESGGSGLRYSFDIKSGTTTYEVGVDAKTGKVLENTPEGKNPD